MTRFHKEKPFKDISGSRGNLKTDRWQNENFSLGGSEWSERQENQYYGAQGSNQNQSGPYGTDKPNRSFFGKGPKGWSRSDDRIREDVSEALHDSHEVDASTITVEVKEGTVTLSGVVDSRQMKREAEACAEHVRGVVDVRNEITVNRPESLGEHRLS